MMWKKLGVNIGVMLGVSLGSMSGYAMEAGRENLQKELLGSEPIVQQEAFDEAEVEDKVFVSAKGHQVKFWPDGESQWRADVTEDFTGIEHAGLPVKFGGDWSVDQLMKLPSSKHRLHVLMRGDLPEEFEEEGLVYVGCQHTRGQRCLKMAQVGSIEHVKSGIIPRPIPNAETYQFMDAIPPGSVLSDIISDSDLGIRNEIGYLPLVVYQSGRYEDAFYFAPENRDQDAEKVLSIYGKNNTEFNSRLILIKDFEKFIELFNKTSHGCANKGGKWSSSANWGYKLDYLYDERNGYTMLDRKRVENAMGVEKQCRSWSCGPNSGLRAVYLLGRDWPHSYDNFIRNCPKRICRETTVRKGSQTAAVGAGLTFFGLFFAPLTMGASLIPGAVTGLTGAGLAATGASISSDVGPMPTKLAEYLSRRLGKHKAYRSNYCSQRGYEESISRDIRLGLPRIILIISGTFNMHYINVIGVRSTGKYFNQVVILDTNGTIGVMTDSGLEHWLNRDGYADLILDARYNTVEFNTK